MDSKKNILRSQEKLKFSGPQHVLKLRYFTIDIYDLLFYVNVKKRGLAIYTGVWCSS